MIIRILAFLAVVVLVTGLIHGYLWARLVRDPGWPAPWRLAGTVALVSFAVAVPGAFLFRSVLPPLLSTALTWGGYIWMGVMFYLLVLLLPFELPRFALRFRDEPFDGERRLLLARAVGVLVSATTAGVSSLGMASALSRVRVKRVPITLSKLPASLDGFTIVQLTDVHVGPTIGRDFIEEIVSTTNGLSPDLIAITGDLVDGPVSRIASLVEPLKELRAPHGVYFVTGNHEYYAGADDWLRHLATLGITPLRNERVSIERDGQGFDLAGVDDYSVSAGSRHVSNLARALSNRDTRRPTVLLAHQPRGIHDAAAQGVDLQLSGHTHGGQIFPFGFLTRLVQPVLSGHARFGETQIYVSNGTGYWGPPMRVGAPAEVTLVTLSSI